MSKTAVRCAEGVSASGARWIVCKMSPPMGHALHVLVSAVSIDVEKMAGVFSPFEMAVLNETGGPEVLMFPCDAAGEVSSWNEIGGMRGTLDHREALAEEGYTLVEPAEVWS